MQDTNNQRVVKESTLENITNDINKLIAKPELNNHKAVTTMLLSQIRKVDFREVIKLPDGEDLKQKHIIFAVVKNLL